MGRNKAKTKLASEGPKQPMGQKDGRGYRVVTKNNQRKNPLEVEVDVEVEPDKD